MSSSASASSAEVASAATRPRGALIVLEGLDRSGKTTQVSRLAEVLSKSNISKEPSPSAGTQRFPDSSLACGALARSYLTNATSLEDRAIHLVFAANRWEAVESLHKRLNAGETVVVDRYSFSGIAYSAMKGLPHAWLAAPEIGLPKPDVVVFLTVSSKVQAQRGGFGDERYEKVELQKKVRAEFAKLHRSRAGREWKLVNADQSEDDVAKDIRAAVQDALDAAKMGAPLRFFEAADFEIASDNVLEGAERKEELRIEEDDAKEL